MTYKLRSKIEVANTQLQKHENADCFVSDFPFNRNNCRLQSARVSLWHCPCLCTLWRGDVPSNYGTAARPSPVDRIRSVVSRRQGRGRRRRVTQPRVGLNRGKYEAQRRGWAGPPGSLGHLSLSLGSPWRGPDGLS
jgi:hypothetical protein